jgi:transposase
MTRETPEYLRWAIAFLWLNGHTKADIVRELGVGDTAVRRWTSRVAETGSVSVLPKSGRKPVLTQEAIELGLQLLKSGDFPGADAVAQQLRTEGFTQHKVHRTTLAKACKSLAKSQGKPIRAVFTKPAKRLREDNKLKRLNFCLANKNRDWKSVMFTDRKRFLLQYPGVKVNKVAWVCKGETRRAASVNHPMGFNIYAGITPYGVSMLHTVAGSSKHVTKYTNKKGQAAHNITSAEYKDVLISTLLPEGERLFSSRRAKRARATWTLQQDNDPSHGVAADTIKLWSTQHGHKVELLKAWPPNSPDLNPIENLWAIVQAQVNKMGCKSFEEFSEAVVDTMAAVPTSILTNLYDSMPARIEAVIGKGGDKINK